MLGAKKECDVESRYKIFWIVKHVGKQEVTFVQAKKWYGR